MFPPTSDRKARSWRQLLHQAVDTVLGGPGTGEAAAWAPSAAADEPSGSSVARHVRAAARDEVASAATPMASAAVSPSAPAPASDHAHRRLHPHRQPIARLRPRPARRPGTTAPRPQPCLSPVGARPAGPGAGSTASGATPTH